jgi:hypothetical protein
MGPLTPRSRRALEVATFLAGATLAIGAFWFLHLRTRGVAEDDPDRYYHLAISRASAVAGMPLRSFPQIEDLGWGARYADKEFLFHVVTTLAYRWGGEGAVLNGVAPALGCAFVAALFALLVRRSSTPIALFSTLIVLGSSRLLVRLSMLRPALLAMVFFVVIIWALVERRKWLALVGCALFALGYHAIYVPLLVLVLAGVLERVRGNRSLRAPLFGALGLAIGVVANPYFPSNVVLGVQHVRVAFGQDEATLAYGLELTPVRSDLFLLEFGVYLAIVAGAIVVAFQARRRDEAPVDEAPFPTFPFALFGTLGFLALLAISPRAIEYLAPLAALLVATTWSEASSPRLGSAILVVIAAFQARGFVKLATHGTGGPLALFDASAAAIPIESKAKVLNCDWWYSPFLLHHHASVRVVDALDPSFLFVASERAFADRRRLCVGGVPDPYAVARLEFKADYVATLDKGFIAQLDADPDFVRVYPPPQVASEMTLFAIRQRRPRSLVLGYDVGPVGPSRDASGDASGDPPSDAGPWEPVRNGEAESADRADQRSSYADLYAELDARHAIGPDSKAICAAVRPSSSELKRLAGARWLGVGEAGRARVWLNGRKYYETTQAPAKARVMNRLVPLPDAIGADDRLEVVVCGPVEGGALGVSLSLWTDAEIAEACGGAAPTAGDAGWELEGSLAHTCLAPIARRP